MGTKGASEDEFKTAEPEADVKSTELDAAGIEDIFVKGAATVELCTNKVEF